MIKTRPFRRALLVGVVSTACVGLAISPAPAASYDIDDVIIEAHRGGPDLGAPENSVELFERAVASGVVDQIEADLRSTKDDVLVIHHNAALKSTCKPYGGKALRSLSWAQLSKTRCAGEPVPTLAQGLEVIRGTDVTMNVELKLDTAMTTHQKRAFARDASRAVLAAGLPDGQVSISSYYWRSYADPVQTYGKGRLAMTAMEKNASTDVTRDVFDNVRRAKSLGVDRMWFSTRDAHRDLLSFITDYGGMEVALVDRSIDDDTRYAFAHGLRVFSNDDPKAARKSVIRFLDRIAAKPLKKKVHSTNLKDRTVLKTKLLRSGKKTFPTVVGSKYLPVSAVRRLEDITFSVTIKGHGKGEIELAPSGSRPGTDGVRVKIPDGTKTFTMRTGPGDKGRIRVMSTGTAKVSVKIKSYRTTTY